MNILYVSAYVFVMSATSPCPIVEVAFGRLHKRGPAASGRRPTFVETITGHGEVADTAKTYANTYKIFI